MLKIVRNHELYSTMTFKTPVFMELYCSLYQTVKFFFLNFCINWHTGVDS